MKQYFMQGNLCDVTVGAYDVVKVRELTGIFMLSLLSKHINKNQVQLYRDGGLAILQNILAVQNQKNSRKSFKNYLEIKIYTLFNVT